jgi:hypothetical protein
LRFGRLRRAHISIARLVAANGYGYVAPKEKALPPGQGFQLVNSPPLVPIMY